MILFATTNQNKLNEAKAILNIDIEGIPSEIDEIQSMDCSKVALAKARAYFAEIKKPLFVEDQSLEFTSLGGLPGPYIKDFLDKVGNDGMVAMLNSFDDRAAIAKTCIAYIDQNGEQFFEGAIEGTVAPEPRGEDGFGWDAIFIPKGYDKTFAQMSAEEKNEISMRAIALRKFKEWLDSK